jgi:outer membrane protein OmpA-like peptidoglycan-associated protein
VADEDVMGWLGGDTCGGAVAAAEAWARGGPDGPRDIVPPSGLGGFEATFQRNNGPGTLRIVQRVALAFKDLLVDQGGTIVPHPDLTDATDALRALATHINGLPEPQRSQALAAYQWSDAQRDAWQAQVEPQIEGLWGHQHDFFLNQRGWEWIGADTEVDLQLRRGAKQDSDHMELETFQTPDNESLRTFDMSHHVASGSETDARDQRMRLARTSLGPKEYDLLHNEILFGFDSATLDAAATRKLDSFIATFDGDVSDPAHQEIRIDLVGHASAAGEPDYNLRLSQRRMDAVAAYLRAHGFHNVDTRVVPAARGEEGADQTNDRNPRDQRVDMDVDGGGRMVTASHEWGHAFGLDDEYGGNIGDPTGHDAQTQAMTDATGAHLPGSITEHNGGIMSYGNEVRAQHYSSFHHALETITQKSPWSLGRARPKAEVEAECAGSESSGGPAPGLDGGVAGPTDAAPVAGTP